MGFEEEINNHVATQIQSMIRRFLARRRVFHLLQSRIEKIYDPRNNLYYYYDTVTDIASWDKPLLLGDLDIHTIAQTYTDNEAALMIQRQLLRRAGLRKVRMLYQNTIIVEHDEGYGATFYFNPFTEHTSWELPAFMNERMDYKYDDLPLGGQKTSQEVEESSESSDSPSDSDLSIDSEAAREKRRKKRRFPRSKVQILVDHAEDNARNGIEHLKLNHCCLETRLTDRIWDLTRLISLDLSNNKLKRISAKIEYLLKLTHINISHNSLRQFPKEISECSLLREFNASHNELRKFTGYLWKCSKIETLNLSHNYFQKLPITVGNLDLLKATKQWEVGIGCLKNLKYLILNHNRFTEWPEQIERCLKLNEIIINRNFIRRVPRTIGKNLQLGVLDLSDNLLKSLPPEIYLLPLRRLIVRNNCLERLPKHPVQLELRAKMRSKYDVGDDSDEKFMFSSSQIENNAMRSLIYLDLSYNKISELDSTVAMFGSSLKKFLAHDNQIESVHSNLEYLTDVTHLDLSKNKLKSDSLDGLIGMKILRSLNVCSNLIDKFPYSLNTMKAIEEINMADNCINEIPEKIFGILAGSVTSLDLHNNALTSVPMAMFAMRKLKYLDLSHNKIDQAMPKQLGNFVELKTLLLKKNHWRELPDTISELKELEVLEVEQNDLTTFPAREFISQCKSLKRVTTRLNSIVIRPPLDDLPSIVSWDMSWNKDIVGNFIDWEGKERSYQKEADIMSLAFVNKMIEKANLMNLFGPYIHKTLNHALVSSFDYFLAIEDQRKDLYAREYPLVKKKYDAGDYFKSKQVQKPKNMPKSKMEIWHAEQIDILVTQNVQRILQEQKQKSKNSMDSITIPWHHKMQAFFEKRLLMKYPSKKISCGFEEMGGKVNEEEMRLHKIESIHRNVQEKQATTQLLTLLRMTSKTSHWQKDPLYMFYHNKYGQMTVMSREIINEFDFGADIQESIDLYESIAKELSVICAIEHLSLLKERKALRIIRRDTRRKKLAEENALQRKVALMEAKAKMKEERRRLKEYRKMLKSRGSSRPGTSATLKQDPLKEEQEGGLEEEKSSNKEEERDDFQGDVDGMLTSRSNAAMFTARTNTSEDNVLMDMAMGTARSSVGDLTSRTVPEMKNSESNGQNENMNEEDSDESEDYEDVDLNEEDLFEEKEEELDLDDYGEIVWNPNTLEHEFQDKTLYFVDYDIPPAILHNAAIPYHSKKGLWECIFACYFGLGVALLRRVDKLTIAIRSIERRGSINDSCLDIAQRLGEDYVDLIDQEYRDTWEQCIKEEEGAKGSVLERKRQKMDALLDASGAAEVEVDVDEPEEEEEGEAGEGKKKQKKNKGPKVKRLGKSTETETVPKEKEEKREEGDVPMPACYEEHIPDSPSISHDVAIANVTYLNEHRQLTVLWANKCLDAADELLKMHGWNLDFTKPSLRGLDDIEDLNDVIAREESMEQEKKKLDENKIGKMKPKKEELHQNHAPRMETTLMVHDIRNFYLTRAKGQQYAGLYSSAAHYYTNVISMNKGRAHETAELERVRVYIALKDYDDAFIALCHIISRKIPDYAKKFPKPHELIRKQPLISYFLLFIYTGKEHRDLCGFTLANRMRIKQLAFDTSRSTGSIIRRMVTREDERPRHDRIKSGYKIIKEIEEAEMKVEKEHVVIDERFHLKKRLSNSLNKFKEIMQEHNDDFEEMLRQKEVMMNRSMVAQGNKA